MNRHQVAEFYGEQFDEISRDLTSAIQAGDVTDALGCRRELLRLRTRAARAGVDVEYDGGWMVPDADSIHHRCAIHNDRDGAPRNNGGPCGFMGSRA